MPGETELQDQAPEQYDLGVLFVHGIGDQQQNSTLARFGGSLQRWLSRWLDPDGAPVADRIAPEPTVEVTAVQRRTGDGDTPAHASLLVGRPGEPAAARQRWLLAEGWWAAEVSPPTFKAFVRWVLPILPWVAAEYAVAAARRREGERVDPSPTVRTRPRSWLEQQLERLSLAGLVWLLSPVLALLAMLGCSALAVAQRVPVIGKRVSALATDLVKGVGDAYLFAYDGLARAAMLQRIRRNLDWLDDGQRHCRKLVIVAHSQGAALCHDLLRSGALRRDDPVDLFVTVGSGVQRLNTLRELHDDAKLRSLGWKSIAGLVALVAGLFLLLSGLGLPGLAGAGARVGGLAILVGCLIAGPTESAWRPFGQALGHLGAVIVLAAGLATGGGSGWRLVAGAVALWLGVWLYKRAARHVLEQVRQEPRLALSDRAVRRWVDFYSTADPVPNGPLKTWTGESQPAPPPAVHPTAACVYNLRSVQADHSYYPDNTDEFVSQLASELTAASGLSSEREPLVAEERLRHARARRRWRTSCRGNARNLLLAAGLLGAVGLSVPPGGGRGWAGLGADLGVGAEGPYGPLGQLARWAQQWLAKLPVVGGLVERVALPSFAAILLAALVVAASAMLLGRLWSVWDSNDVDRFFLPARRLGRWRTHWPSWAFLGLTGSLVLGITATVTAYAGGAWLLVVPLAAGLLLTAALVWVRWRTCLDERDDRRPAVATRPQLDSAKAG
ncbi:MAG TPA: hypothetical protein VHM23_00340 [Actinomycetota bacterium]|jgi:hypothetical protein|nr:hypothetical protein [Actinomycetota bacterium]